jgi:heat-inducible transcriptional repressor
VSSKGLVEQYDLDVSSATVRHELAALDEMGYLVQLHTSAGRIPTEVGYRYFVQKLLGEFRLPIHEEQMIRHQFHQARLDLDQWMKLAAAILARTSLGASFVTAPRPRSNRFKHLQLISTQGRLVLMILVLYGGEVKQQMLTLAEPLSQARLSAAADRMNLLLADATYDEAIYRLNTGHLDELESDVAKLTLEALRRSDTRTITEIYRDGLMNIVEDARHPAGGAGAGRADLAGERAGGNANVAGWGAGGDWRRRPLGRAKRLLDSFLSRYGVADQFSGTVAVIGPTRMSYGRNVAAVQYVANLMSGFVYDYYLEDPDRRESV